MAASTTADLLGNRYGHLPYRRRVITYSTNSTATYFLADQESGAIFYVPNVSTAKFTLPRISSNRLGVNYEFQFTLESDLADYNIDSTIDSSAAITLNAATSAVSTASAITPASTIGSLACRLTAVSSITWLFENVSDARPSSANTTGPSTIDLTIGQWFIGTTVA